MDSVKLDTIPYENYYTVKTFYSFLYSHLNLVFRYVHASRFALVFFFFLSLSLFANVYHYYLFCFFLHISFIKSLPLEQSLASFFFPSFIPLLSSSILRFLCSLSLSLSLSLLLSFASHPSILRLFFLHILYSLTYPRFIILL